MFDTKTAEAVATAVAEKHVVAEDGIVAISEKASPDGKAHERKYTRYVAVDARGMAALCGGKIEPSTAKPEGEAKDERTDEQKKPGACDYFNYGFDLDQRASVRASLMTELEGPEKAITKAVKALVDGGLFNETEARELVIRRRKENGLAV